MMLPVSAYTVLGTVLIILVVVRALESYHGVHRRAHASSMLRKATREVNAAASAGQKERLGRISNTMSLLSVYYLYCSSHKDVPLEPAYEDVSARCLRLHEQLLTELIPKEERRRGHHHL